MALIILLVLAGTLISANGWQIGKEYTYKIDSQSVSGFNTDSDQLTGIVIQASLVIQPTSENNLKARVTEPRFDQFHHKFTKLFFDLNYNDMNLNFKKFPISESPFEIVLKNGVIVDLIVNKSMPVWEINILRSFVSQLQLDLSGQNAIGDKPKGVIGEKFKVMEESITGKCEVKYTSESYEESTSRYKPELVSVPELKDNDKHIILKKEKNYSNCDQTMMFHFGLSGRNDLDLSSDENKFFTKASYSKIVIAGDLKNFVIQTAETADSNLQQIYALEADLKTWTMGKVNLTLERFSDIQEQMKVLPHLHSAGSLIYDFNDPFKRKKTSSSKKQPEPTLDSAPDFPLLPYFVGNEGHALFYLKENELIGKVVELCTEIGDELEKPNDMFDQQTLEKMTILTKLLRTMSAKVLQKTQEKLYRSKNSVNFDKKADLSLYNRWAVFRDAVGQTGTGPALLTIKSWIEKNLISPIFGELLLGVLPKKVITPTKAYIEKFYELLNMPQVVDNYRLHKVAVLSFADILRKSTVLKKSARTLYPVYAMEDVIPDAKDKLLDQYLPYFSSKLAEAVKKGDSLQIQIFTTAIGKISDPKILKIFEPYLDKKQPVTKFQRAWMVLSLDRLSQQWPSSIRPVLYKIYENMDDDYEVRCAAVYLIMMTDPPLEMMQKMANNTHSDSSEHVNSAVKSTIQSAMSSEGDSELKTKATSVVGLLKPDLTGNEFTFTSVFNTTFSGNIDQSFIYMLGSDDAMFPKAFYRVVKTTFGHLKVPSVRHGMSISSIRSLMSVFNNLMDDDQTENSNKWTPENIARMLQIEGNLVENMEGNAFVNMLTMDLFEPFDHTFLGDDVLKRVVSYLTFLRYGVKEKESLYASYEVTISFPLETGFPYVFTMEVPAMLTTHVEAEITRERTQSQLGTQSVINTNAKIQNTLAMRVQGKAGFITPFDGTLFMTGFNGHIQFYLPVSLGLSSDRPSRQYSITISPINPGEKYDIVRVTSDTYTSNMKMDKLVPITKDENTKLFIADIRQTKRSIGYGFEVDIEYDSGVEPNEDGTGGALLFYHLNSSLHWASFSSNPHLLKIVVNLESADASMKQYEDSEGWSPNAELPKLDGVEKYTNDPERRKRLLNEVMDPINFGKADAIDVGIEILGRNNDINFKLVSTIAYGYSDFDVKHKLKYFFQVFVDKDPATEWTGGIDVKMPRLSALNTDIKPKIESYIEFDSKTCMFDYFNETIKLHGTIGRSPERQKYLLSRPEAQACMKESKEDGNIFVTCDKINILADIRDQFNVSIMFNETKQFMKSILEVPSYIAGMMPEENVETNEVTPTNKDADRLDFSFRVTPKRELDIHMFAPNKDIYLKNIGPEVFQAVARSKRIDPPELFEKSISKNILDERAMQDKSAACIVDKTTIKTFDEKVYPLQMGQCWHVILTTYPNRYRTRENETLSIPYYQKISIVSKDTADGFKEVKVNLGEDEVFFYTVESQVKVKVNDNDIKITKDHPYTHMEVGDILFVIYPISDKSIRLASTVYDLTMEFDGQHMDIDVSYSYYKSVRGLCGNLDGNAANDIESPKQIKLGNEVEFVKSWALMKDEKTCVDQPSKSL